MFAPIIFLNRFYAPDHSATAQILTDLAVDLAAQGRDVTVIASRGLYGQDRGVLPRRETTAGVTIHRVTTPRNRRGMAGRIAAYLFYLLLAPIAAARIARRGSVLVVKTDPPLLSVPLAIVARLRGAVLIPWLQDLYPEVAIAYGIGITQGPLGRVLTGLRNRSLRQAARIVAIGELMADRVARIGIERDHIAVIPNWSNDADIVPLAGHSPDLRAAWAIPPDAFVLAYSGNLGRAHEYGTVLAAATALRARADIVFLFVGGGHMSEQLAAQVAALGLTNFRFVPYQPREKLSESLATGNAHWISLRPAFEGLIVPSKVFGVCAAGRAVVAVCALDGELARLIVPAGAGVAVAPGDSAALADAIVVLADDRVKTAAMGRAARTLLDGGYTRAHALARWLHLLDTVSGDTAAQ
ncbi:glycosyltransferase family 4 protein [Sphingomonas psychrolutea]|uniref:Glycosyltransferase WbuB n=1 Tax=Sphingomonas psychrolutea TaxID=1259676 RepID=A0ABQ1G1F9_9SPHN|nr:glycosyltransferase family 4 protein [Sphingomonas psychrolutea]GGA34212.1 glycosyltransferase WbuB [Sphingomonas psychrolutea]